MVTPLSLTTDISREAGLKAEQVSQLHLKQVSPLASSGFKVEFQGCRDASTDSALPCPALPGPTSLQLHKLAEAVMGAVPPGPREVGCRQAMPSISPQSVHNSVFILQSVPAQLVGLPLTL